MVEITERVLVTADYIVARLKNDRWNEFLRKASSSRRVLITYATRAHVHKLTSRNLNLTDNWHKSMKHGKQYGVIVEQRSAYKLRKEFRDICNTRLRRYNLSVIEREAVALALQTGIMILTENDSVKRALCETRAALSCGRSRTSH